VRFADKAHLSVDDPAGAVELQSVRLGDPRLLDQLDPIPVELLYASKLTNFSVGAAHFEGVSGQA
jgi:hypothetical protein